MTTARPAGAAPHKLYSLQTLRFVAVFGVLVHHSLTAFAPLTTNFVGAAGVDLFFVISGVVIGYIDHDDGIAAFAAKRVIRILPLYWIATAIYGVFRFYVLNDHPDLDRIVRSLFLIPHLTPNWMPIYYPGWTLCYELSFYIMFGLLLAVSRGSATLLGALVAIFLAAVRLPIPFQPGGVFDTAPFLEFGAGLLIAESLRRGFLLPRKIAMAAVGLAVLGFALSPVPTETRVLVWGGPAVLLVFGAVSLEGLKLFRSRALTLGGDASYALYLFHIPIMEGIVHLAAHFGLPLEGRFRFLLLREVLLLGAGLAAGVAMHLWVERPMLRWLRRLLPRRPAILTS